MINCFQLCTIWNYIKYSNKRRKQQYKNAYGEMQQNKHLMKGSEGRNVFFPILFYEKQSIQYKRPIQMQNEEVEGAKDKESQPLRRWGILDKSDNISVPQFTHLIKQGISDYMVSKIDSSSESLK